MRRILLLVGLILPLTVQAREPRPVAPVTISLSDGKKINLTQYKGKVVLFVIFSTTCQDCLEALQVVNNVQKDLGPKGFQAIAGAGDDDAQYKVTPFIQRYKFTFPIAYVSKEQMIALADIEKGRRPIAPIFLFIDKTSTVRFEFYGDHPFFRALDGSTRSIIENLLEGK